MKFREVFRLEVGYQIRRPWMWAYLVAIFGLILRITTEAYTANARIDGYFFNAPFVSASMALIASLMGLLVAAGIAGDAAARDVQLRMHPLLYTSPLTTRTFLAGRFLAAFSLTALVLLAAPVAVAVSTIMPGIPSDLLGPGRPFGYVESYLLLALPNAFIVTALLFSAAALSRRAVSGYLGAVVIFFTAMSVWIYIAAKLGHWTIGKVIDPMALTVFSEISRTTTGAQKNSLSLVSYDWLLINRAIWMVVALSALALTLVRFRFEHPMTRERWWRWRGTRRTIRAVPPVVTGDEGRGRPAAVPVSRVAPRRERSFAFGTYARQTAAIATHSFRAVAFSWGGLILTLLTLILVVFGPSAMSHMDIPLIPTTQQMTAFVGNTGEIVWLIIPLLTVFYAGELVSREREAGLSEIGDSTPAPEWARLVGKFGGLALVFAAYQAMLMVAAMLIQVQLGYYDFEPALYIKVLFGLQLIDHVLFALLAITVHVLVNQKYVGYLVTVMALALTMFAGSMGIEHKLLIYGADTGWTYTDLRRFGPAIAPWLAFKLYWGVCAILLAVVAKLFYVRGRDARVRDRLRIARARLTRGTLAVAGTAAILAVTLGVFVLYNTNILNAYETADVVWGRRAEYERLYKRFAGIAQPRLARTTLRGEIFPREHRAELHTTYRLVNRSAIPIDSIHVSPRWRGEMGPVTLDRPATLALNDTTHRYRIYALASPLAPGDSVDLSFVVRLAPRGFTNAGVDASVSPNGTFIDANDWMPGIGYQRGQEVANAAQRSELGLPPRIRIRSLEDSAARMDMDGADRVMIETIVGTDADQIAMAPGALEREWTENGRRYFHYTTGAPMRNDYALFSAAYAVREATWRDPADPGRTVTIQVLHHPSHTKNPDAMIRSMQASLSTLSRLLGPYPYDQVRLVEHPGNGGSLHAYPMNISFEEEFSLLESDKDPRDVDFPFAVVAHEVAHQWWGGVLNGANVEGAMLLSESLAWYSAMSVVEEAYGSDDVDRLLGMFRSAYVEARPDAAPPLLRAYDRFHGYRKGPFVMYALRQYVGADSIDAALGRFIRAHGGAKPPLPTSLDLYRELRAATPDSLRPLLADLFERNAYWQLETKRIATREVNGAWQVTLDVAAHKVVVDTLGVQTEVPMDDLIEVGVYAPDSGGVRGKQLYLRQHRVRAGDRQIVVTVPSIPGRAGIDPRNLLIDLEPNNNTRSTSRGQAIQFQ